jgi:hypothetical protein
MISLEISVEEPFTSDEAREILQLRLQNYNQALSVGTLQASGVIRVTLPCRVPHHTFWDLFRYCILAELVARLTSAPALQNRVDEFLDDVARHSEDSPLDQDLIRVCMMRPHQYSSDDGQMITDIYSDSLERAVLAGFKRVNAALQRVYASPFPPPSLPVCAARASIIS